MLFKYFLEGNVFLRNTQTFLLISETTTLKTEHIHPKLDLQSNLQPHNLLFYFLGGVRPIWESI